MRHVRKLDTLISEVVENYCNICGLSCQTPEGDLTGLIDAEVVGQFNSTHLVEGDVLKFSFCERCLAKMAKKFFFSAFQGNCLHPDPENDVEDFDPMKYRFRGGLIHSEDPEFQELVSVLNREEMETLLTQASSSFDPDMIAGTPPDEDFSTAELEAIEASLEAEAAEDLLDYPRKIKKEDLN